jgi:hypothetical protein
MMAVAAVHEDASSLIVKTQAPRIRYVPLIFTPSTDTELVTVSFGQWVFEYMRDELTSIGLTEYKSQREVVDEMDDATLALKFKYALERINLAAAREIILERGGVFIQIKGLLHEVSAHSGF